MDLITAESAEKRRGKKYLVSVPFRGLSEVSIAQEFLVDMVAGSLPFSPKLCVSPHPPR